MYACRDTILKTMKVCLFISLSRIWMKSNFKTKLKKLFLPSSVYVSALTVEEKRRLKKESDIIIEIP